MLDKHFCPVFILQIVRTSRTRFLEIILMIRSSEHTFASPARRECLGIWQTIVTGGAMCLCPDNFNYQPKPNGLDRSLQLT